MNDSIAVLPSAVFLLRMFILLPFALMIPAVTVELRLKGFQQQNPLTDFRYIGINESEIRLIRFLDLDQREISIRICTDHFGL